SGGLHHVHVGLGVHKHDLVVARLAAGHLHRPSPVDQAVRVDQPARQDHPRRPEGVLRPQVVARSLLTDPHQLHPRAHSRILSRSGVAHTAYRATVNPYRNSGAAAVRPVSFAKYSTTEHAASTSITWRSRSSAKAA